MRCPTCGCRHTSKDHGRKVLKEARYAAHMAFDALWDGEGAPMTRTEAYRWLARVLELPPRKAHIRYFSVKQCELVIVLVRTCWITMEHPRAA